MAADHRQVLLDFVPRSLCKELEFIHKSCSVIGYRPHVRSTTLSHLIATNCSGLILPVISIRDRLKDLVEAKFGCEFELFVEFTGLISWMKGAQIGWHSDDNRPYLKQRHFAAVCYLNDYQVDFEGGLFHFCEGEPASVVPSAGTVVIYSADHTNTHCVDEVLSGERCTLALWLTKDSTHDEDVKLIHQLSLQLPASVPASPTYMRVGHSSSHGDSVYQWYPMPASISMYWEGEGEPISGAGVRAGYDVRCARLAVMGYAVLPAASPVDDAAAPGATDEIEAVVLQGRDKKSHEFRNSLHALQVVQFQIWQSGCESTTVGGEAGKDKLQRGDHQASSTVGVDSIERAQQLWECYISTLSKDVVMLLPEWQACQALFPSPQPIVSSSRRKAVEGALTDTRSLKISHAKKCNQRTKNKQIKMEEGGGGDDVRMPTGQAYEPSLNRDVVEGVVLATSILDSGNGRIHKFREVFPGNTTEHSVEAEGASSVRSTHVKMDGLTALFASKLEGVGASDAHLASLLVVVVAVALVGANTPAPFLPSKPSAALCGCRREHIGGVLDSYEGFAAVRSFDHNFPPVQFLKRAGDVV